MDLISLKDLHIDFNTVRDIRAPEGLKYLEILHIMQTQVEEPGLIMKPEYMKEVQL